MITLQVTQLRTAALLLYLAGIPFAAHAADSSSTTIAMSNIATPGAVADAYIVHTRVFASTDSWSDPANTKPTLA